MEGFKIGSSGRLLRTDLMYDEVKRTGEYVTKDVTDQAPRYLFSACTLDKGVILRDIFKLLKRHLAVYKLVMAGPVEAIVEEGLRPYAGEATTLDYLELCWSIGYNPEEKVFFGNILPEFQGISLSAEYPFGLSLTPANKIAGLPLKLNHKFTIGSMVDRTTETYEGPEFSLGQILYGIIRELVWCSSPAERDELIQRLA